MVSFISLYGFQCKKKPKKIPRLAMQHNLSSKSQGKLCRIIVWAVMPC
jgi:hypothetical protein